MNSLPILGKRMNVDFTPFLKIPPEILSSEGGPLPVEPVVLRPYGGVFRLPRGHAFDLGERVRIRFWLDKMDSVTLVAAVAQREQGSDGHARVLLNFLALVEHKGSPHPPASHDEVCCPKDYLPLVWGEHPWFFKHRLHFKIKSFIKGGMVLQFGREAKTVGKKLAFKVRVVLPSIDVFEVNVEVEDTDYAEDRELNYCAVRFLDPPAEFLAAVSRYLFANVKGVTRQQAESLGYPFPSLEYASSFLYVANEVQMQECLELRLKAYRNREGANQEAIHRPEQMRDRFDDHSLVFSIQVGGRAVGTGRLVLNNGERDRSEIGSMVELPQWIWKTGFVEFSRFATDENYRGRDVFANLGLHSSRVAHQLGYRYVVADCEDSLLPAYRRRGARPLGIQFTHPLEGARLHVIYYDAHLLNLAGRILTPKRWAQTWGAVLHYYRN